MSEKAGLKFQGLASSTLLSTASLFRPSFCLFLSWRLCLNLLV